MRLTPAQRLDWLRRIRSDMSGRGRFVCCCAAAAAPGRPLKRCRNRPGAAARRDADSPPYEAQEALDAATKMNVTYVALGEGDDPARLAEIDDAPPLMAVRGRAAVLNEAMIAVVGSRNASAAGIRLAEQLSKDLGTAGLVVVSGLARGIDAAAHRASVATGTVAVPAGGPARIYPPAHASLAEAGAAVSELPLTYGPRGHDFPRRNRLISGLSLGVIVVEAAQKSGSLITGRMALEQNREIFAVPGSPLDPRTAGTNALIKQGATMVTEADDVLAVLRPIIGPAAAPLRGRHVPEDDDGSGGSMPDAASPDVRARVVALLGPTPVPVLRHDGAGHPART